jgi:hypothetical protein
VAMECGAPSVSMGDPSGFSETITAHEFRLVDSDGRVRVVIGELDADAEGPATFGMELRDADGRARLMILLGQDGPVVAFDFAGNNILQFGVNDTKADAPHVGAFLYVTDLDGNPVRGWEVLDNGVMHSWLGGPTR